MVARAGRRVAAAAAAVVVYSCRGSRERERERESYAGRPDAGIGLREDLINTAARDPRIIVGSSR